MQKTTQTAYLDDFFYFTVEAHMYIYKHEIE